ncbi:MAG TPA: 4-hydroxy-tetrahydrodipicolinate reductase [Kofleriaceae bacterium]|nr:4-hydroxy-tetrahydrodipicolinate reductase [Kofleriaceae bacterium]
MIKLAVLGPSGRMGRRVIELAAVKEGVQVHSAIDRSDSPLIGQVLDDGVVVTSNLETGLAGCAAYVDFTTPESTAAAARAARHTRVAAVVGTTGLGPAALAELDRLAETAPVLVAANFSLGVNLLLVLAESAARALGPDFDFEVVELHHRHKRDAPSGTALALARALAAGRDQSLDEVLCTARSGDVGERGPGEIGVFGLRGGETIGEHTAYLIGDSERIEISHRAASRDLFAAGALRAATWLAGRPPGHYRMRDVLGL